jgi:hypothetical protein
MCLLQMFDSADLVEPYRRKKKKKLHTVLWLYMDSEFKIARTSAWEDFIEFRNTVIFTEC